MNDELFLEWDAEPELVAEPLPQQTEVPVVEEEAQEAPVTENVVADSNPVDADFEPSIEGVVSFAKLLTTREVFSSFHRFFQG